MALIDQFKNNEYYSLRLYEYLTVSFSGKTDAFGASDAGSIPATVTKKASTITSVEHIEIILVVIEINFSDNLMIP